MKICLTSSVSFIKKLESKFAIFVAFHYGDLPCLQIVISIGKARDEITKVLLTGYDVIRDSHFLWEVFDRSRIIGEIVIGILKSNQSNDRNIFNRYIKAATCHVMSRIIVKIMFLTPNT